MKKIITLVIAIAMVLACAVPAMADSVSFDAYGDHFGDREKDNVSGGYSLAGGSAGVDGKIDENGVNLAAEVEIHAAEGSAEARGGSADNNAHVGASASAGTANAAAKIGAGIDENGNIKAGAKASAEAIAAEANAKVGATVGGVEVNATGGVKVGVGAHAECTIENGKLKVDMGAALGLGLNVGFEVDVSRLSKPRELDLHGPSVTGPADASRIGDFQNTDADGIHTTFATYGPTEPDWHGPAETQIDWHGPASATNDTNTWNFHGPASAMNGSEAKPAENVEFHNTDVDGIHVTSATF